MAPQASRTIPGTGEMSQIYPDQVTAFVRPTGAQAEVAVLRPRSNIVGSALIS